MVLPYGEAQIHLLRKGKVPYLTYFTFEFPLVEHLKPNPVSVRPFNG